jgi:hypothetical protein
VLQAYWHHFENQLADRYLEPEGKGFQNFCDDIENMKAEWNEKELGPANEKAFKKFENNEVSCSKAI